MDTFFRVKEGKEHDIFISESIHDETQFFIRNTSWRYPP